MAFSREENVKKVYVQDVLWEKREYVYAQIIKGNGVLMLCGSGSTMGKGVYDVMKRIVIEYDKISEAEADEVLAGLIEDNKYIADIWG